MPEKTEFLPFHAINEFMRPDFRLSVIREVLTSQAKLEAPCANELGRQIKKRVSVPGFRNSDKAPALVKVLPTKNAFEKYPELVAAVLSCWTESQPDLRQQVFALLKNRNWPVLVEGDSHDLAMLDPKVLESWPIFPIRLDRSVLPGFNTHWYKGEDFETLYTSFTSQYPEVNASIDKVSLMVVWISMRLPYQVDLDLPKPGAAQETQPTA